MAECWKADPAQRPSAAIIVLRLRVHPIYAAPTSIASDWDPLYTSKFRSSLEEHTLRLSYGKIDRPTTPPAVQIKLNLPSAPESDLRRRKHSSLTRDHPSWRHARYFGVGGSNDLGTDL
ncbi:hypothetical protein DFH09DRAFT_1152065 [Mycena vulgaris]|nr:hypothetical protein DFH09DRAFT_1152065 [Mycena vulgaris]